MSIHIDANIYAVVVMALGVIKHYLPERGRRRRAVRLAVIRPGRRA